MHENAHIAGKELAESLKRNDSPSIEDALAKVRASTYQIDAKGKREVDKANVEGNLRAVDNEVHKAGLLPGLNIVGFEDKEHGRLIVANKSGEKFVLGDNGAIVETAKKVNDSDTSSDNPLKTGDRPAGVVERSPLPQERADLLKKLDAVQDHAYRERFVQEMVAFEKRGRQIEDAYRKQGLSPEAASKRAQEEMANTYHQIARLFDPQLSFVPRERLGQLAEEMICQAAHPTTIDQGGHGTCNVTTVESRTYTLYPSVATEVVADIALRGSHTATDGTIVNFDSESLVPDKEAIKYPRVDGERSFASQLFQVYAVKLRYENENKQTGSKFEFKQTFEHEVLIDNSKVPPEQKLDGPFINADHVQQVSNQITGKNESDLVLERSGDGTASNTKHVESEEDFKQRLLTMKNGGRLPAIVVVNVANEPFNREKPGWHFVTVTDYDESLGVVSVDNQWSTKGDHLGANGIKVHDLYNAIYAPDDPRHENSKGLGKKVD